MKAMNFWSIFPMIGVSFVANAQQEYCHQLATVICDTITEVISENGMLTLEEGRKVLQWSRDYDRDEWIQQQQHAESQYGISPHAFVRTYQHILLQTCHSYRSYYRAEQLGFYSKPWINRKIAGALDLLFLMEDGDIDSIRMSQFVSDVNPEEWIWLDSLIDHMKSHSWLELSTDLRETCVELSLNHWRERGETVRISFYFDVNDKVREIKVETPEDIKRQQDEIDRKIRSGEIPPPPPIPPVPPGN